MEILRWQVGNTLNNYQYIICDTDKNALLIDPLDTAQIRKLVADQKLNIKALLITHEHDDHAAEAGPLQKQYGAAVYSSAGNAKLLRANVSTLKDMEPLAFSSDIVVRAIETPGHAAGHMAFEINGFLFSGDCLFHGGCGHCRLPGANLEEHYNTVAHRLAKLSPDLILMPGHYYARRNLQFSLHVEPENARALALLSRLSSNTDEMMHESTLKQEREYNPFLRLGSRTLRTRISELTGRNMTEAADLTIFKELRLLRDAW